jgi:hypothetical protein
MPATHPSLSLAAGDVIHNLRAALDHLVQHLYLTNNPGATADPDISFFVGKRRTGAEWETEFRKKAAGLDARALQELLALEAYRGGKGHRLWALNELNNIDKHRLLLVIDLHPPRFNVGACLTEMLQQNFREHWERLGAGPWPFPPFPDVFVNPAKSRPLQVGDVIEVGAPDEEVRQELRFAPVVAFSEPGICEGQPILEVLVDIMQHVEQAIECARAHLGGVSAGSARQP